MNAEIEANLPQIKELCEKYGVIRLELFGSATGPGFDPETSDFDFIAAFGEKGPGTRYGERFFSFVDELETVVGRAIDVLGEQPIRNPYFARSVNESRQTIYESTHSQVAV